MNNQRVQQDQVSVASSSLIARNLKWIIVAEDRLINMEVIKLQFRQLGVEQVCKFCFEGKDAFDTAIDILHKELLEATQEGLACIQPIKLMHLDFQMPKMNGFQVS